MVKTYDTKHREGRERENFVTDKVPNIKSVVVGPEGVVLARIPTTVGTNNVASRHDWSEHCKPEDDENHKQY